MPNEPFWLPPEEIIDLNRDLVAATGEPFLLRDRGLLESACARPVNLWAYEHEDDVLVLAVSLLLGVAQNHVFMQGNKRTAFLAALMMLRQNGWRLDPQLDSRELADLMVSALREDVGEHTLVQFLRPCLHRVGV